MDMPRASGLTMPVFGMKAWVQTKHNTNNTATTILVILSSRRSFCYRILSVCNFL
jgi:hypothetical protein